METLKNLLQFDLGNLWKPRRWNAIVEYLHKRCFFVIKSNFFQWFLRFGGHIILNHQNSVSGLNVCEKYKINIFYSLRIQKKLDLWPRTRERSSTLCDCLWKIRLAAFDQLELQELFMDFNWMIEGFLQISVRQISHQNFTPSFGIDNFKIWS